MLIAFFAGVLAGFLCAATCYHHAFRRLLADTKRLQQWTKDELDRMARAIPGSEEK